jgi:tetratricopeptide (TPR) repeat protein
MARLYRNMGSYDLVAATLENCADSARDNEAKAKCLYELAQSYSFISSWSQAVKTLDSLLALKDVSDETRALGTFLLADIYENDREYAKARALLESILTTYPNPKVVETRLANLPEVEPEPLPLVPPPSQ